MPCGGTPDEVASPGQFLVRGDTSPERNASPFRARGRAGANSCQGCSDHRASATPNLRGTASATHRRAKLSPLTSGRPPVPTHQRLARMGMHEVGGAFRGHGAEHGEREGAGKGQDVRIDHPLCAGEAEVQIALHRGQRDVHDRDVEDDDELCEARDGEDYPVGA